MERVDRVVIVAVGVVVVAYPRWVRLLDWRCIGVAENAQTLPLP